MGDDQHEHKYSSFIAEEQEKLKTSDVRFYGRRWRNWQITLFLWCTLFFNPSGFLGFFKTTLCLRCVSSWGLCEFCFKMNGFLWGFWNDPFCTIFFLNGRSQKKLSRLHVTYEGTIESNGQGMLQVSAYNSSLGFCVFVIPLWSISLIKLLVYPQLT